MRERLVELSSVHGVRAASVDEVTEGVGTTKVSSYRHVTSTDDLVVAHLHHLPDAHRRLVPAQLRVRPAQ